MMSSVRKIVLVTAAALAALSVAEYLAWRASHRRLTVLAADAGLTQALPQLEIELRRQTIPARAATLLAWQLLAYELDGRRLLELPAGERAAELHRGIDRLRLAHRLARSVLPRQPASWQAATVLGAARYFEAERAGSRENALAAWRDPLRAATQLAPGHPEPARLLASAYLSRWSSLTAAERSELRPVLARALEDVTSFELLIPTWVRLAPSMTEMMEPIPDRPAAWERLGREFLRQDDLERYCVARQRWLACLPEDLDQRIDRARARLAGGARGWAVDILRGVLAAPARLAHAEAFSAAVQDLPAEIDDVPLRRDLARWLRWALALCQVGRCPLSDEVMAELGRRIPGLPEVEAALSGRLAEGADPAAELARDRLRALSAAAWPASAWTRQDAFLRLELWPERSAGLRIDLPGLPARGAAVELVWDGQTAGVFFVPAGEDLTLRSPASQEPHLLEILRPER